MSTNEPSPPKDELLPKIWSVCSTLTEEAFAAATAKAVEMNLDQNRGLIPLQESFINLSSARFILEDAISGKKLNQLPLTVQKEIFLNLEQVSKSLQGLAAGTDEIVNITNAVEALNTSIWKYGLHNLSDEVLGYQKKLNQLKNQEVQLRKVASELDSARKSAETATKAANELEQKRKAVNELLEQIQQNGKSASAISEQIRDAGTKSGSLFTTIQQQEKQSGELASSIRTASNELTSLDASIRKFYGEVEEYRAKINKTTEDASSLIRTSEATVKKLVEDTTVATAKHFEDASKAQQATTDELRTDITAKAAESRQAIAKLTEETQSSVKTALEKVATDFTATTNESKQAITKLTEETQSSVKTALDKVAADFAESDSANQTLMQKLEEGLTKRSDDTIGENDRRTKELVEQLETLKDQIKVQIQQATGFQLFGAFQARQNEIAKSKQNWARAIGVLVVISAGVTAWIAHEAQAYSVNSFAFWVKLSLTIPLGFALTFCTVQYSRERRLEEEYAFKSSISVSLNPYRDMILSILEKGGTDLTKYTEFVIESVRNVFTPPTDKVFEAAKRPTGLSEKTFKQVAEVIGTGLKAAK